MLQDHIEELELKGDLIDFHLATLNQYGRILYRDAPLEDLFIKAMLDNIGNKYVFRDLFISLVHVCTAEGIEIASNSERRSLGFGIDKYKQKNLNKLMVKLGDGAEVFSNLFSPIIGIWRFKEELYGVDLVSEIDYVGPSDENFDETDLHTNILDILTNKSTELKEILSSVSLNVTIEKITDGNPALLWQLIDESLHTASLIPLNLDMHLRGELLVGLKNYNSPYGDLLVPTCRDYLRKNGAGSKDYALFCLQTMSQGITKPYGLPLATNLKIRNRNILIFLSNFLRSFGEDDGLKVARLLGPIIGEWVFDEAFSTFVNVSKTIENIVTQRWIDHFSDIWSELSFFLNKDPIVIPFTLKTEENVTSSVESLLSETSRLEVARVQNPVKRVAVYKNSEEYQINITDFGDTIHKLILPIKSEELELVKITTEKIPLILLEESKAVIEGDKVKRFFSTNGDCLRGTIEGYVFELSPPFTSRKLEVYDPDGNKLKIHYKKSNALESKSFSK